MENKNYYLSPGMLSDVNSVVMSPTTNPALITRKQTPTIVRPEVKEAPVNNLSAISELNVSIAQPTVNSAFLNQNVGTINSNG